MSCFSHDRSPEDTVKRGGSVCAINLTVFLLSSGVLTTDVRLSGIVPQLLILLGHSCEYGSSGPTKRILWRFWAVSLCHIAGVCYKTADKTG